MYLQTPATVLFYATKYHTWAPN